MNGLKKNKKGENGLKDNFRRFAFPTFWPPGEGFEHFGPQIRILRQKSCLEPAGNLENPSSRPNNVKIMFLICFLS